MVFNTGAALLDAVVLAVVSKEKEGTYARCFGMNMPKFRDILREFMRLA